MDRPGHSSLDHGLILAADPPSPQGSTASRNRPRQMVGWRSAPPPALRRRQLPPLSGRGQRLWPIVQCNGTQGMHLPTSIRALLPPLNGIASCAKVATSPDEAKRNPGLLYHVPETRIALRSIRATS